MSLFFDLSPGRLGIKDRQRLAKFLPLLDHGLRFPSAVEHMELTPDHTYDGFTARAEVVAGVEFRWFGGEDLPDFGRQGQT